MENNSENNLTEATSETLAAIVVAYKSLGFNKQLAVAAMVELSNRQAKGDSFDYEQFIQQELDKIPKPQAMNISSILKSIKGMT